MRERVSSQRAASACASSVISVSSFMRREMSCTCSMLTRPSSWRVTSLLRMFGTISGSCSYAVRHAQTASGGASTTMPPDTLRLVRWIRSIW